MNHLTHEELILHYYGEADAGAGRQGHLDTCEPCRADLAGLAAVLDRVTPVEVPEPAEDYESQVWNRLQWRLRGEKKPSSLSWMKSALIAATAASAFFAGVLWKSSSSTGVSRPVATATSTGAALPASTARPEESTRVLLVVVGEHFGESERVLVELTNLTAKGNTDITTERQRAEELLASNRLYRSTAIDRGEESVATLLDELEPVLLQIAHAPDRIDAEELRAIQKRVEAKGLVFKLRVVRADVHRSAGTPTSI